MGPQIRVLIRMRDVALALGAAESYNQSLNRIRLQKFIYLLDVVGYLYEILPPREAHTTYKNGPYDYAIQNAVDSLAFRGLAQVLRIKRSPNNKIHAEYGLTPAGKSWLKALTEDGGFGTRWEAALEVAKKVNLRGWSRLVDLVYAEPTFASTKPRGYGQQLPLNNGLENSAAFLMQTINRGISHGFDQATPDRELVVELFFRYLDNYARSQRAQLSETHGEPGGEY